MFFSFDGIDGVGKSTQMNLFAEWLRAAGREVIACRDPGGTKLGEAVRRILLTDVGTTIGRRSEMLLYMAARAQLVDEVIQPALAAGRTVVCDRYLLANVVYQGHAGGLDVESIWQIGQLATAGVEPDLTLVLDLPVDMAVSRIRRELDRMENQGDAFRHRLRAGFLGEAARRPDRIAVIDASGSVEEVQQRVRDAAARVLT